MRERHLEPVARMSRFLIRPGVDRRSLASKAPGMFLRRVADDHGARHGPRPPPVETFVDGGHDGSDLRAANRIHVGGTAGRGGGGTRGTVEAKAVWPRPLRPDVREVPGIAPPPLPEPPGAGDGPDRDGWAGVPAIRRCRRRPSRPRTAGGCRAGCGERSASCASGTAPTRTSRRVRAVRGWA